ncbi:MAG: hypothetical protein AMJ53_02645 [Gammaproteobacteria bacterium SG8_11]|nr:MAG: hypothetical protein AMJ53_02645 [Gammaproteobacteria bacterium SG8_11]
MFFHSNKETFPRNKTKRRAYDSILATVGYILSPLSWWNDLVVNVPLSYAFSYPFTLIDESLFLPTFILGYWLSNWLGFILLHRGVAGLLAKDKPSMGLRGSLVVAIVYTIVIAVLVWLGWIPVPTELLQGGSE